ncbi:putative phosphatase regulatory subunit-domain-containing protein, partial [Dipodascopsis uninucleata]
MPYTPPTTSPVVPLHNQHGASGVSPGSPEVSTSLPPSIGTNSISGGVNTYPVLSLNRVYHPGSILPRSASFLHKQPRSAPQKYQYFTEQNSAQMLREGPSSLSPSTSSSLPQAVVSQHSSRPTARHIEAPDPDDEDDSSTNVSSTDTSPESTDDEDPVKDARRRLKEFAELQQAVKQMPQPRRQGSPSRSTSIDLDVGLGNVAPVLSKSMLDLSTAASVFDTDAEEDMPGRRKMVRKKSGELVKPSLKRPSSVPATPTYPKNVHFDDHLEHVRHFLRAERPTAVSNTTSPLEEKEDYFPHRNSLSFDLSYSDDEIDYAEEDSIDDDRETDKVYRRGNAERSHSPLSAFDWAIEVSNMPERRKESQVIFLERIFLSKDQRTLIGHVAVKNLAFNKYVAAKFTLDYWGTVSEVSADYSCPTTGANGESGYDRFTFSIKLQDFSKLEKKTLLVCIRYNVNGMEFWDNNSSKNYELHFIKRGRKDSESKSDGRRAMKPPCPEPLDRSFDSHYLPESRARFGSPSRRGHEGSNHAPTSYKVTSQGKLRPATPTDEVPPNASSNRPFTSRYDFGASLNAVMSPTSHYSAGRSRAGRDGAPESPIRRPNSGPSNDDLQHVNAQLSSLSLLSREKPAIDSMSYKNFLDNYCFYQSSSNRNIRSPQSPSSVSSTVSS